MELKDIRLDQIRPNPHNPRGDWGDIQGLADSIGYIGLLSPLVVVRDGNVYRLVAGERRYKAMKEILGMPLCSCLVCDELDEANEMIAIMGDNAHRKDFDEEEAARGVQQMLILGVDENDVASASGRDRRAVADFKRALGYVRNAWTEDMGDRQLSFEEARMLAEFDEDTETDIIDRLLDAEDMEDAYEDIMFERAALDRARKASAQIEEAGATEIPYSEYMQMDRSSKAFWADGKRIGPGGCGCDGFSATVTHWGVEWFCTKPENHPDEVSEDQRRENEERERWYELAEARRAFIVSKMNNMNGGADLTWWMQEAISGLLGKAFDKLVESEEEPPSRTFFHVCVAYVWDRSEGNRYAIMEGNSEWCDGEKERFASMLENLQKIGYTLQDEEQAALERCREILDSRKEKK